MSHTVAPAFQITPTKIVRYKKQRLLQEENQQTQYSQNEIGLGSCKFSVFHQQTLLLYGDYRWYQEIAKMSALKTK